MTRLGLVIAAMVLASAPAAARAQAQPSADKIALAHDLIEAAGGAASMQAVASQVSRGMITTLRETYPEASETMIEAMRQSSDETLESIMPDLMAISLRLYADTFTEAELRDLAAFYRSPTGHSAMMKMPVFGAKLGQAMGPLQGPMQLGVLSRFCSKVECPPALQAQVARLRAQEKSAGRMGVKP